MKDEEKELFCEPRQPALRTWCNTRIPWRRVPLREVETRLGLYVERCRRCGGVRFRRNLGTCRGFQTCFPSDEVPPFELFHRSPDVVRCPVCETFFVASDTSRSHCSSGCCRSPPTPVECQTCGWYFPSPSIRWTSLGPQFWNAPCEEILPFCSLGCAAVYAEREARNAFFYNDNGEYEVDWTPDPIWDGDR